MLFRSAAGNSSSEIYYSFYDESPLMGLNHYRLKFVDIDGSYEYSPTRVVYFDDAKNEELGDAKVILYPNPAKSILNVSFYEAEQMPVEISIVDALGKECFKSIESSEVGMNVFNIDLNRFNKGIYYLNEIGRAHV